MVPRAVLVERPSEYDELLARHATHEQVRFFLEQRGRALDEVLERHAALAATHRAVLGAVPADWRAATVLRADLDRFLFEPGDVVLALGQDGLVANVAKYLDGQPVIGLNPDPAHVPGVLVRNPPEAAADLLADLTRGAARIEERTMARARLDDGQEVLALNEIFVGHETHQSARYTIALGDRAERQSSSGVIAATGTGATGWAASINRQLASPLALPGPTQPDLAFFVREAWPSSVTATTLTAGRITAAQHLTITCELGEGGTVFGDGIEADHVAVDWGQRIEIGAASRTLRLVG
jgi:DNA helicase HerA-like ATPase